MRLNWELWFDLFNNLFICFRDCHILRSLLQLPYTSATFKIALMTLPIHCDEIKCHGLINVLSARWGKQEEYCFSDSFCPLKGPHSGSRDQDWGRWPRMEQWVICRATVQLLLPLRNIGGSFLLIFFSKAASWIWAIFRVFFVVVVSFYHLTKLYPILFWKYPANRALKSFANFFPTFCWVVRVV